MNTTFSTPCQREAVRLARPKLPGRGDRHQRNKDTDQHDRAHANLISTHNTFGPDYEAGWFSAPFFDIENEHHVKTDLWMIGNVALTLMHYFYEINERRNVIKFVDNFWPLIQALGQKNDALRAEM